MITSQAAINEIYNILSTSFTQLTGGTGEDHLYGEFQIASGKFLKLRVADHGVYMSTFVSHSHGVPPTLSDNISVMFRDDPKRKIGSKWQIDAYTGSPFVIIQYVYPSWDLDINEVKTIGNSLVAFANTGDFDIPFLFEKDVKIQELTSNVGIRDITNAVKQMKALATHEDIKEYCMSRKRVITESAIRKIIRETLIADRKPIPKTKNMVSGYQSKLEESKYRHIALTESQLRQIIRESLIETIGALEEGKLARAIGTAALGGALMFGNPQNANAQLNIISNPSIEQTTERPVTIEKYKNGDLVLRIKNYPKFMLTLGSTIEGSIQTLNELLELVGNESYLRKEEKHGDFSYVTPVKNIEIKDKNFGRMSIEPNKAYLLVSGNLYNGTPYFAYLFGTDIKAALENLQNYKRNQ